MWGHLVELMNGGRMSHNRSEPGSGLSRRVFLQAGTVALAAAGPTSAAQPRPQDNPPAGGKPTQFQIACMTLPYSRFPLQRALEGLQGAGYRYVAWGTSHQEGGKSVAVMPPDAPPARARDLAARCRDLGLEPVMMFSN